MPVDISKIQWGDELNLREACMYVNLGEQRLRTLSRSGEIPSDVSTGRRLFKRADLDAWLAKPRRTGGGGGGVRPEGKAYVIMVKADQMAQVKSALDPIGIEMKPKYDAAKMKAQQARRRERQKAEKANGGQATETPATAVAPVEPKAAVPAPAEQKRGILQRRS